MNRAFLIILTISILNCYHLNAQLPEIDFKLLTSIENSFEKGKAVNLEYKLFGFCDVFQNIHNEKILNTVAHYLKQHTSTSIRLAVHTDCRGSDDYNLKLTQKSTENLKKILVKKGVLFFQIEAVGFGETQPLIECEDCDCESSVHELNRRVTIKQIQ